jgi:hypothetical protein
MMLPWPLFQSSSPPIKLLKHRSTRLRFWQRSRRKRPVLRLRASSKICQQTMLRLLLQALSTARSSSSRPRTTGGPVLTIRRTLTPFQTGWSARKKPVPHKVPQRTLRRHQKWSRTCPRRSSCRRPRLREWRSLVRRWKVLTLRLPQNQPARWLQRPKLQSRKAKC